MKLALVAQSVQANNGRAVVLLTVAPGAAGEDYGHGQLVATIPYDEEDGFDEIEEGEVYNVTLHKSSAPKGSGLETHVASLKVAQVRVANSTNDPNYVTPPEQKVPPIPVPEGTVTLPRPSVVIEPPQEDVPADAGVVTAGPTVTAPATSAASKK